MKFSVDYNTPTEGVSFENKGYDVKPIEIKLIANEGARNTGERAKQLYLRNIDYLFRGVCNFASGDIKRTSIVKEPFGSIIKDMSSVHWNLGIPKTSCIIYSIDRETINEHLYVADSIATTYEEVQESKATNLDMDDALDELAIVTPVWQTNILKADSEQLRASLMTAIAEVVKHVKGYYLAYGYNGKDGIFILNDRMEVIDLEEIEDDYLYQYLKYVTVVIQKGKHMGVMILDCEGMPDNIIRLYQDTLQGFYGDTFFFIYNVAEDSEVDRDTIELPEF